MQIISLISIVVAIYSFVQAPDWSGVWKINLVKSQFNGAPTYSLNKAIKIIETIDKISIRRTLEGDNGADSLSVENFALDGKSVKLRNADGGIKELTLTRSADGKSLTEKFSYTNSAGENVFTGSEVVELSADKKALLVTRHMKTSSGFEYTVKGWYDRISE